MIHDGVHPIAPLTILFPMPRCPFTHTYRVVAVIRYCHPHHPQLCHHVPGLPHTDIRLWCVLMIPYMPAYSDVC